MSMQFTSQIDRDPRCSSLSVLGGMGLSLAVLHEAARYIYLVAYLPTIESRNAADSFKGDDTSVQITMDI